MALFTQAPSALILLAVLLVVLPCGVVMVATARRYRKRSREAVAVHAGVADALRDEDSFRHVIIKVRVPFWGGDPTITLAGQVDGREQRQFARRIAVAHASRVWRSVRIEDGIVEQPRSGPAASLAAGEQREPMSPDPTASH